MARFVDFVRESAWFLPAVGALIGITLGVLTTTAAYEPVLGDVRITIDRERDTLLAVLALLFTGLSIVLSVGLSSIQTVAARFSLRLLSVIVRSLETRVVVSLFVVALSYMLTVQVRLRTEDGDEPARALTLLVGMLLLILSGVAIIGYIGRTSQWMRADRTLARVRRTIGRAAHRRLRARAAASTVSVAALAAPADAGELVVSATGYLTAADVRALRRVATDRDSVIGLQAHLGRFLVPGDTVGWIHPEPASGPPDIDAHLQITQSRQPAHDETYGLRIITDMALSALSPAVNDPYTAVQAIETLTAVLTELAQRATGPYVLTDATDTVRVVVFAPTLADYLRMSTEQILIYGAQDPTVMAALERLAREVERVAPTDHDRDAALDLQTRTATAGAGTDAA